MIKEKNRFYGRVCRRAAALFLSLTLLGTAGCSGRAGRETGAEPATVQYSAGQIRTVAITERNRYQNIYTAQIWEVKDSDSEENFEAVLMDQIRRFFLEMGTINLMADQQGIELTAQENEAIRRLAQEYYGQLTQEDRDCLGVSQDEIYDLYNRYYRADKLVTELTASENLEVSDAQAKVIRVQQIVLSDRETAEQLNGQVREEKADFAAFAKRYSRNGQTEVSMEYTGEGGALEQTAFRLEQDEISPVIEENGLYYLIKCVNPYDKEATDLRKERLEQERKNQAFQELYGPFAADHPVILDETVWDQIRFAGDDQCHTANFFELYQDTFSRS